MKQYATRFLTFIFGALIGVIATGLINSLAIPTIDPPTFPTPSEITQISYEVINDELGGNLDPGYELTFVREGREKYSSSVIKITRGSGTVQLGDLWRGEFDQLVTMLEAQKFLKLEAVYPRNTGCADCVIKKITAVRGGQAKTVVHLDINVGDEIPVSLWTIERALEGTIGEIRWQDLKAKDKQRKF